MSFGKAFALIMFGVVAWGVFHAIGAYRFNHDIRRALMVLGCVVAFLAFWGAMLWSRKRRLARESQHDDA